MAKNKEINIFSVSFLDLLSGALAAVIILFIIIPKSLPEDRETLETLEEMQVSADQLRELIEQARNAIPQEIYEQIQQELDRLNQLNEELTQQVQDLERQMAQCEQQNQQMQQQVDQLTEQLQQANQTIAQLQDQITTESTGFSDIFFGVSAKLGIVCTWEEDIDVDLWLKNNSTGEWCNYQNTSTTFGTLQEDLTSRSREEDFYELIYQRDLVPGTYDIFVHLYSSDGTATVSGFAALFPGRSNEVKFEYGPVTLTNSGSNSPTPDSGGGRKIGTLIVTDNGIQLNR